MGESRDPEWAALLGQAFEAGLALGRTVKPTPITVVMPDLLTDEADEDSPREVIEEGASGGAALEFSSDGSPEANDFLEWLQRGESTAHPPPFRVSDIDDPPVIMTYINQLGPSADPNIAAAEEMVRLLRGRVPGLIVASHPQLS